VDVKVSDGTHYELKNEGPGINKKLSLSGNNITFEIKAYDYNGNTVYSGTG
jgi:hypothetical protein